ncbi:aldo/keto reductase [Archaeoglobus profundus]|uniref:Aldo/keto reductase n=1 Tax=Archaeoglobus profundus (strain DSM 5631 / JCM 9629 / NBRC 100127 / Av18) TaxID=572546 RepID=D2RD70_ARCPA|nr:aldo/keto reductase [Archaeoglobus profundus]ADB58064.1 aldo/keto reductase [Archaeoglobus profundus DSM 5631]
MKLEFKKIDDDKVTAIGMGTWGIGGSFTPDYSKDDEYVNVLRYGINLGLNIIDTAEMYGAGHTEEIVGKAIETVDRDSVFIISKIWPTNYGYESAKKSVKNSCKRLGTYVDLHLLHWPVDDFDRIVKTLHALEELADAGFIRYIGVSNFDLDLLIKSQEVMKKYEIIANEVRFSLIHRYPEESGLLDYMRSEKVALIAHTPLEKGLLARNKCLDEIGRKYGKTAAQVALNWLIQKDIVIAIPKAAKKEHLRENCGAMGWRLSKEDCERALNCVESL